LNQSIVFRTRWRRFILAAGFLYLALLGWSRLQQSLLDWDLLQQLGARPGPLYLAAAGAMWGVLGLAAALLTYLPHRWAARSVLGAALLFAASYWADFLIFTRAAEMMANWPFALGVTLLSLLYCAWAVLWQA
jgi:hypothetical protein